MQEEELEYATQPVDPELFPRDAAGNVLDEDGDVLYRVDSNGLFFDEDGDRVKELRADGEGNLLQLTGEVRTRVRFCSVSLFVFLFVYLFVMCGHLFGQGFHGLA